MIRAHEAKTDQKFTPAKAHILKGAHLAKARELAAAHHPKWDLLKESAQNLHTRNMGQVLGPERSEEHTSELQSLMRISYAVFRLKQKNTTYSSCISLLSSHILEQPPIN